MLPAGIRDTNQFGVLILHCGRSSAPGTELDQGADTGAKILGTAEKHRSAGGRRTTVPHAFHKGVCYCTALRSGAFLVHHAQQACLQRCIGFQHLGTALVRHAPVHQHVGPINDR